MAANKEEDPLASAWKFSLKSGNLGEIGWKRIQILENSLEKIQKLEMALEFLEIPWMFCFFNVEKGWKVCKKRLSEKCKRNWREMSAPLDVSAPFLIFLMLVHYAFKNPTIDEAILKNQRKLCPEFVEDSCIGHRRSPRNNVWGIMLWPSPRPQGLRLTNEPAKSGERLQGEIWPWQRNLRKNVQPEDSAKENDEL